MKRLSIMTIIILILITQGCSNQATSLPEPEASIQVENDSTLKFNRVEMKLYQDDYFVASQNGMYADMSLINQGDSLTFDFLSEDPIQLNSQAKVQLMLYLNDQQINRKEFNVDFSQSDTFKVSIKDETIVLN